ncbi:fatty acyl-CoA reductase 3-like isoform X2 [Cucumis sativus]|uniref:fatty acyl-CoA reductase 3-like isoform X2 n=1 Tax=Cucumis sativus TaxID=3659 RepID=UPI0012F4DE42|nr:fatty acyl-CoA reductase 3-like isoform X2 [Cucumis sativus]
MKLRSHNGFITRLWRRMYLIRVLKEKWGGNINGLISEKIYLVIGNITSPNLGLKDSYLLREMKDQIEIIVNLAATTKFDERYVVAFGTNTLGAKHLLNFAKQCSKLEVVVHVSTAYVSGEKEGIIEEIPYKMGESLNGTIGLNIEEEQKLVEETLNKLISKGATQQTISLTMKQLGLQRIIDTIAIGYGKGTITFLPFGFHSIFDAIPADMVVNAMIMTMIVHAREGKPCHVIYHVGSSRRNGIKYGDLTGFLEKYFVEKPWINRDGKAIKVRKTKIFNNMVTFGRYMAIRYSFLLKGLKVSNIMLCHWFQEKYDQHKKKYNHMMRLVQLYRPYLFFKATFDDTNTERLRRTTRNLDLEETFYFDPTVINWKDYFFDIHIPGLVKYVIK